MYSDIIIKFMKDQRITWQKLGSYLGVTRQAVNQMILRKSISVKNFIALGRYMNYHVIVEYKNTRYDLTDETTTEISPDYVEPNKTDKCSPFIQDILNNIPDYIPNDVSELDNQDTQIPPKKILHKTIKTFQTKIKIPLIYPSLY